MKRYNSYKPSGVSWIAEVPSHWDFLRAKNMFYRIQRPVRPEDEIITCFRDGQVTLRKNRRTEGFTEALQEAGYQGIRKGDLVIHQMDAFAGSVGVSDSDGKGTPVYICCLPKSDKYFNFYYAHALREMARTGFIKSLYRGIRERSSDFRYETFAVQRLPIPPLDEQKEIVAFLESKISKIDSYVTERERELAAIEELRRAEIARVVTHGLNPDVPMRDSGISWLGKIPAHWETKRIALLFSENIKKNDDYVYDRAMKFNYGSLVPKNEEGDISDLKDTYIGYTILHKNDIAINGLNLNYDFVSQRVALSPSDGIITSAYLILSPRENINSEYFSLLFKAMDSMKLFHGMGTGIRLTLSYSELKKQMLPIPPIEEQQAIVDYINAKTAKIDGLIADLTAQIEKLKEYKLRLIADAVTGQIDVRK